jgi:hypothetical protein
MTRVVWWSDLGGLSQFKTLWFLRVARAGIAIPGEAFWGLGSFDRWGELLVPLKLGLSSPIGIS